MPLDFNPGSLLVTLGAIAVALGLWWQFAPQGWPRFPLGNLPGDIRIQRDGFSFFMPITTCLVISGILWLVQTLLARSGG
jgi:formate hydrogenlyase subunit 3/multisubunit Na+/H+ antiporter MnhD subunit